MKIFEKICENESVKTAMKKADLNEKDLQFIKNLIHPPAEEERNEEVRGDEKIYLLFDLSICLLLFFCFFVWLFFYY